MGEKQIFGITVGAFAAVVLVVGVLIYFSYSRLNDFNDKAAKYEAQRRDAQATADKLDSKRKEKKDIEERVADCNQYLPKDDDIERTLLSLSGKCSDAGLRSSTLKIETAQAQYRPGLAKLPYESIRYRGDFEGSFHQLAKFVSAVENWKTFKRFVSITTFGMEADAKGLGFDDGSQKHKIKMTLELYKYPEPTPAAEAGVPGAGGVPATPGR
jgi:Tfp pilus assembly protein PilO